MNEKTIMLTAYDPTTNTTATATIKVPSGCTPAEALGHLDLYVRSELGEGVDNIQQEGTKKKDFSF